MRISVDGSRIRNNKVAFSNLSGIVADGARDFQKSGERDRQTNRQTDRQSI